MIIAFINYVRELSIFTICHPVKLRHSQQYITTAQGGGFLRGNKMLVGQKVTVRADVFSKHPFEAKIASFSPATGSTFALLPPDNASGNFVKVVQRLPVRIEFDNPSDSMLKKLRPGMNVEVDVHLN